MPYETGNEVACKEYGGSGVCREARQQAEFRGQLDGLTTAAADSSAYGKGKKEDRALGPTLAKELTI